MSIGKSVPLSRKRSLAVFEEDAELWRRSTLTATAEDGLRYTNRPLLTEGWDFEEKSRRKRVRTSERNGSVWATSPPETGSDSDGGIEPESCEAYSTFSPRKAASPAVQEPYVSFGEEADPVYRRIQTAVHKYYHALDSNKLRRRLHDLPTENEYVPHEVRDPTPTPPDSVSTVVTTPPCYQRCPSEWERMENENRERAKSFCARFGLKVIVNDPPPPGSQPDNQNSASSEANHMSLSGKATPGVGCEVDEDVNPASYETTLTSTQNLTAPPANSMLRGSGEVGHHPNWGSTKPGILTTVQDETFQLPSSSSMGMRQNVKPRARGTAWEGKLRHYCKKYEKVKSKPALKCSHMGYVASRASTRIQQSRSAPSSHKHSHTRNQSNTSGANHCESKGQDCHKSTEKLQTELRSHKLDGYITPSPDHLTVEEYLRSSAQQRRHMDVHSISNELYGRSPAQAPNPYATPSSRSSLESSVWQRSKRENKLKSKRAARQGRHRSTVSKIADPISSRLRSNTSCKRTP